MQHFHLSHNYADSISVVGRCAFVQVGVIGDCNRDGLRHSRLLRGRQGMPSMQRQPPSSPAGLLGQDRDSRLQSPGLHAACSRHPPMRRARAAAGDRDGYQLFTVDHEDGSLRLDLAHGWADTTIAAAGAAGRPAAVRPAVGELTVLCHRRNHCKATSMPC